MNEPDRETLERLVSLEPGVELAALLGQLDTSALSGYWLVEYVGAAQRLKAWVDARVVAATNELGYCPADGSQGIPDAAPERVTVRHGGVVAELETRLGWGRGRAGSYDSLSYTLSEEFPDTWAMLHAGDIDLAAARAIADTVPCLEEPGQRREVEQIVLAWIRKLMLNKRRVPPHQIRHKVNKEVARIDPEGARKRHEHAVRSRGLRLVSSLDSVADLHLHDIPADEAVVIFNYVDALARDVQNKTSDERPIGHLRADIAASLLSGMAVFHHDHPDGDNDGESDAATGREEEPAGDGECGIEAEAQADAQPETGSEGEADPEGTAESEGEEPENYPEPEPERELPGPSPRMAPPPEAPASTRPGERVRAKNILHVSLTDLLGLHEVGEHDPAILGGYGPVVREVAERILAHHLDNPDAEYTVVVTDPRTGRPRQIHPVNARLFTGRLREVIDIRWRNCTWPTPCDKPAADCVGDHSTEYAQGGETSDVNGNPLCNAHNREKTRNGWTQHRPDADTIIWTSAFGHTYGVHATDHDTNRRDGSSNSDPPPDESPQSGPKDDPPPF